MTGHGDVRKNRAVSPVVAAETAKTRRTKRGPRDGLIVSPVAHLSQHVVAAQGVRGVELTLEGL